MKIIGTHAKRDTDEKLLTADDLLRLCSEGVRGELVRGVLHETMSTGHRHGTIVTRLILRLGNFVEPRGLGTLVASDSGVWLERDPDTVREPDIAYTSAAKIPLDADIPGYPEEVPDLVVEVKSPSDSRRYAHERGRMWVDYGVRIAWVLYPETRTAEVHRPDQPVVVIDSDGTLDGADVLPGFTCPLNSIFVHPTQAS
ncbi:MAG: Uma2 family endonuclease [Acidimicrobiales bacterium]|nr:Uma2 family endonuclease [Acidimicrobiales bacterium]MYD33929.1 Uma2 family endonuclease [Acidimicrobiales bacterium]MYI09894.1 Uma2 family endonuclease [Acidimicrobiales bacterium]